MEYIREVFRTKKYVVILLILLAAAEVFLFSAYGYHWLKICRYMILSLGLVLLGFIDAQHTLIPNHILLGMLGVRGAVLAGEVAVMPSLWKEMLLSAFGGLLFGLLVFGIARLCSRGSVGMGDVKLVAVIGWYLGGSLIWLDMVGCLSLAALFSIIQLARKRLSLKMSIPLAPFFTVGTIVILLLGF